MCVGCVGDGGGLLVGELGALCGGCVGGYSGVEERESGGGGWDLGGGRLGRRGL